MSVASAWHVRKNIFKGNRVFQVMEAQVSRGNEKKVKLMAQARSFLLKKVVFNPLPYVIPLAQPWIKAFS